MAVEVCVFGPVRSTIDGAPVKFASLRSAHLLGYLVVHSRRPRAPAAVAEDLWPEQDHLRSRKALNTELWRLRSAFEAAGGEAPVDRDEVALRLRDGCRSDYRTFWEAAEEEEDGALDAARGTLMEGCYDDWLLIPREMAVAELSRRLTLRMHGCMAAGRYNRAIRAALKLIEIDPLLEAPHRVIMRAQDSLGNRAAAMRQFQKLKAALQRELQVPPLEETIALYTSIVGDAPRDLSRPHAAATAKRSGVIDDLLSAEARIRRARLTLSEEKPDSTSRL